MKFFLVSYTKEICFIVTEMEKKIDKFQTFFLFRYFIKIKYMLGLACGPPDRWLGPLGITVENR